MQQDKNSLNQLSRIFASLGQTPDEVARTLRASDCRGYRCGSCPSPVIRYVYRWFDEGSLGLIYGPPGKPDRFYLDRLDGSREELSLPPAIAEFLALFDEGAYPDLDLEAARRSA